MDNQDKKIICPFCGKEVKSRDGFCEHCGISLREPRKQKKEDKSHILQFLLGILFGIIVIAIGFCLTLFLPTFFSLFIGFLFGSLITFILHQSNDEFFRHNFTCGYLSVVMILLLVTLLGGCVSCVFLNF